jgi:hypothetical protein
VQPDLSAAAEKAPESSAERQSLRNLAWTLALAAVGALGALPLDPPGPRSGADPLFALVWAASAAPIAGACAGRLRLTPWTFGLAAPAAWTLALVWASTDSPRLAPTPLWAAAAWMGLFAFGAAAGRASAERSSQAPWLVALAATALNAAAWAPGALGSPWAPHIASTLLDLAPVTLVVECAGLDWMRHDFLYRAVQTDRFERAAWSGALAGPSCLLLGYSTWTAVEVLARRRRGART